MFTFAKLLLRSQEYNRLLGNLMSQDPIFILVILSMAVVIVLMIGIGGFGRGGEFNRKYANKLMRLRILAQFLAVAIILLFVYLSGSRG